MSSIAPDTTSAFSDSAMPIRIRRDLVLAREQHLACLDIKAGQHALREELHAITPQAEELV